MLIAPELAEKLAAIELAIFDVDGVLTDGRLYYGSGGIEIKAFHVQDGAALKLLMQSGIGVAIITGRASEAVTRRVEELGIPHFFEGVSRKELALAELEGTTGIDASRMSHMGDDLADLSLFDRVGVRFSVESGHPVVKHAADFVATTPAGYGAVREVSQLILETQGKWLRALNALR